MQERSKDWLILNAIECWLYYYPAHDWTTEYKELREAISLQMQKLDFKSEEVASSKGSRRAPVKSKTNAIQTKEG